MMNLKKNLYPNLPEFCFAIDPSSGVVVLVQQGEVGYYPFKGGTVKDTQEYIDDMNARLGVTPAQAVAMAEGSVFGFHVPAANPDNYDDNGTLRVESDKDLYYYMVSYETKTFGHVGSRRVCAKSIEAARVKFFSESNFDEENTNITDVVFVLA
jgi:hypothetical protein